MSLFDPTPLFRLYARQRVKKMNDLDPVAAQENLLRGMVDFASMTEFGLSHDFAAIRTIADYQHAVGLRRYEDFWLEFWEAQFPVIEDCTWPGRIPFFALTSGTTMGPTKYIPFTKEMMLANSRAGLDLLALHVTSNPNSSLFSGKSLMLGGSSDLSELAPGVYSGDLSGIVAQNLPLWVRPWSQPSRSIALMNDWEKKITILAEQALRQRITSISGVPSWLNLLFAKMAEQKGTQDICLAELLPDLQLLIHGGISFAPYRHQYEDYLVDSSAEMREVYAASEGFIGIADEKYNEGLRLCLEHGLFYEFVPVAEIDSENPTRHWIDTIETDINYAVVVSSCAGLWSFIIGDTVRFVDRTPPRLLVTGRLSYSLSVFGEHLIGEEIETAIARAAASTKRHVTEFSVSADVSSDAQSQGQHIFLAEFSHGTLSTEERSHFISVLDDELCNQNADYHAHRADGFGLQVPQLICAKPGAFEAWMKDRGKLGGQHKVPRVILDNELFQSLQQFVQRYNTETNGEDL